MVGVLLGEVLSQLYFNYYCQLAGGIGYKDIRIKVVLITLWGLKMKYYDQFFP